MQSVDLALGFGLLGGMLVLLVIGIPIAYSLLTAGLIGLMLTRPWIATEFLVSTFPYSASANLAYVVLPLFLCVSLFGTCNIGYCNIMSGIVTHPAKTNGKRGQHQVPQLVKGFRGVTSAEYGKPSQGTANSNKE